MDKLSRQFSRVRYCWADMSYRGDFPDWCKEHLGWQIEIVKRPIRWGCYLEGGEPSPMPKFTVLPRRWIVERTIAWIGGNRRMSKDYEYLPETSESFIYAADELLTAEKISKEW